MRKEKLEIKNEIVAGELPFAKSVVAKLALLEKLTR